MKTWAKWAGLTVLLMFCAALVLARQEPTPPDSVVFEKDVAYREVDGETLKLDIARPKDGDGPFPCVVFIHGGGWRAGDKRDFRGGIFGMAGQGAVGVSVQYRFAPKHPFPAQVDDVKAAVRYIREHAKELKVDPDRIAALGGSAGAYLALMLATTGDEDPKDGTSSAVKAAVSLAGPVDLTITYPIASRFMLDDFMGKDHKDDHAAKEKASPLHHLNAGDAPVLLIHGTKDELVPYEQIPPFAEACKKAGVEAEVLTIEGGGHGGGDAEALKRAIVKSVSFLRKHLGMPPIPGLDEAEAR
ncbi:alpha/beta hydrolase [Paludisphaera rhizosphaerae]|uniref:alpha/beta hydrolase n=1 Tax=Paludisphaera rhizosphaerae TaxID=2711216 RepID=UPI0013EAC2B3|nr:alpha/beta hydrolase [Paludisphaera rhizosphaerae]